MVLDKKIDRKIPLILGRPFLGTVNAHIDVGAGEIQLNINGNQEKFAFKPKVEQCSIIMVKETHPFVHQISTVKKVKSQPQPKPKRVWHKKLIQPLKLSSSGLINTSEQ